MASRGAGASLGRSATTVQSTLAGCQPAARIPIRDLGEEAQVVGAGPGRVGVGEVLTDVAEAGGAQQGVGAGVGGGVGVAVAPQRGLARGCHAPEGEHPVAWVLVGAEERVQVEALPHPDARRRDTTVMFPAPGLVRAGLRALACRSRRPGPRPRPSGSRAGLVEQHRGDAEVARVGDP